MGERTSAVWMPNKKRQVDIILRKIESSRLTLEALGERVAYLGIDDDFSLIIVSPENSMIPYLDGATGHFLFEVDGDGVKVTLKPGFVIYDTIDNPNDDYLHKVVAEVNKSNLSPWVIEFSAGLDELVKKLATKIDNLLDHMELSPKPPKRKLPKLKEDTHS